MVELGLKCMKTMTDVFGKISDKLKLIISLRDDLFVYFRDIKIFLGLLPTVMLDSDKYHWTELPIDTS